MKSPRLMSQVQQPECNPHEYSTRKHPVVVRQKSMQQGLLLKASTYASNACKPNTSLSQFKGILVNKRDPLVWGDATRRYTAKDRNEINNNNFSRYIKEGESEMYENTKLSAFQGQSVVVSEEDKATRKYVSITKMPPTLKAIDFADPLEIEENDGMSAENDYSHHQSVRRNISASPPSSSNSNRYQSDLSFNTTQQLRSGFFRSIKRQYSPILMPKQSPVVSSQCSTDSGIASSHSTSQVDDEEDETTDGYVMSKLARHKLEQLRRKGVANVDVPTGLQWIRLELHEMREQDKSLFLQLIKLHSSIKDLRADMSDGADVFDSYEDLHSAASLWWPRRGHSFNTLPDFSSSDGAQLIRGCKSKTPLRRGFSLNYPPASSPTTYSPDLPLKEISPPSSRNDSKSPAMITSTVAIQ